MAFIKELVKLPLDYELLGFRGYYLLENARLVKIPQTFVLQPIMIEEFLTYNSALQKINSSSNDQEIFSIFSRLDFPEGMEEEINDLFEILSVRDPYNVSDFFGENDNKVFVRLLLSPSYLMSEDLFSYSFLEGYFDLNEFKESIKRAIALAFTSHHKEYRLNNTIEKFSLTILIQKLEPYERHAVVLCDKEKITIKAKFGLFDFNNKGYDVFVFDRMTFDVLKEEINYQEEELKLKKGELIYSGIRNIGVNYKINLKEAEHLARITKKISELKNKEVLALFHLSKEGPVLGILDCLIKSIEDEGIEIKSVDSAPSESVEFDVGEEEQNGGEEEDELSIDKGEEEILESQESVDNEIPIAEGEEPTDTLSSSDIEIIEEESLGKDSEESVEEFIFDETIITDEAKKEFCNYVIDFAKSNFILSENELFKIREIEVKQTFEREDLKFLFNLILKYWK